MAGPTPDLLDLDPDRILIAIEPHLDDALNVARGLALAPQAPPRSAEVPRLATRNGPGERLRIHMRDHQHLARARIAGDAGHEPVGIELGRERKPLLDVLGRAARREAGLISQGTRPMREPRSAFRPAHHGDEADLLFGNFTERPGELGRDGHGAGLLDPT